VIVSGPGTADDQHRLGGASQRGRLTPRVASGTRVCDEAEVSASSYACDWRCR
jgi:hypothetical protein